MSNPPISTQTPPSSSSSPSPLNPDYRKGNGLLQENPNPNHRKRLDDARRSEPNGPTIIAATGRSPSSGEVDRELLLRPRCRSQNQCNDKWDNLLRDFKKVTHHESEPDKPKSYWEMERVERKEKGLPSNFGVEVFEALRDVVGRRKESPDTSETSDSGQAADTAEPDPKRQKVRDTGSSLIEGASMIARTLLSCEEKQEKRHRDLIQLHERRLRLESDRIELNRQGFAGLISAVSSLSSAIHAVSRRDYQNNGDAS
ncbi:uncharacterized protein A4U43_C04F5320 [Asparagus officinalis]|uniref:Myb/SANT-like DNA-binding domain-containing protein n=1 Tax=Asparagus officinalis TaxID=4686 RepID=A0A5P1F3E2_ASPOF|nr:uncharacterized protein A4U43_C04F5320 [Asparagus officinalis]